MPIVTSVRIEDDLKERLETLSVTLKRPKGWVINEALRQYLDREQLKRQRWRETEEALEAIETDDVYDADEVHEWMDSWFTGNEQTPPNAK